jgi:two-component sensor histidine kinase
VNTATMLNNADTGSASKYPDCGPATPFCPVTDLRHALAREEALLHQKDDLIEQLELLSRESDHRLLNNMQIVASLLSMQSRASVNPEVAAQLQVAAHRVTTILRIHTRLHSLDKLSAVSFKQYLEEFCQEFGGMLSSEGAGGRQIKVDGDDMNLPAAIGIPLGFIANELITNAAKYSRGDIFVTLTANCDGSNTLSVCNDGLLPDGFNPSVGKGLGMKIIQSFVRQIAGEFRFDRGANNEGTKFTVDFPAMP